MIYLKNEVELDKVKRACLVNAVVHDQIAGQILHGTKTSELDRIATEEMAKHGGRPSFRDVFNYPGSICVSVNDEIGHGVPGERVLLNGDVVKIDIGVEVDGFHSDCARTYIVGGHDDEDAKAHLVHATRWALQEGLAVIRPGRHLSDVSHAIGQYIENEGLSVVKRAQGHGIGQSLHEDPQIPNYGPPGKGPRLRPGMVLAIEPVVVDGDTATHVRADGWTEVTNDGCLGAHFEHTVRVTETGVEVLTMGQKKRTIAERLLEQHGIRSRPKQEADHPAILGLAKQEMDPILLQAWGRPVHPVEVLTPPDSDTYVLVDKDGVVGFYIFSFHRPYLHLNTLVIHRRLHGSGLARVVMDLVEYEAARAGTRGVELWVQTNNRRAIRFYQKLGFEYTGAPYFRTWSMRKELRGLTTL